MTEKDLRAWLKANYPHKCNPPDFDRMGWRDLVGYVRSIRITLASDFAAELDIPGVTTMKPNVEALRSLLPDLEAWTGGERRDLDGKIAVALGYSYEHEVPSMCGDRGAPWYDSYGNFLPHGCPSFLGTDPAIVTEDAQRLVKKFGYEFSRDYYRGELKYHVFLPPPKGSWEIYGEGHHLMLALVRALIEKESGA